MPFLNRNFGMPNLVCRMKEKWMPKVSTLKMPNKDGSFDKTKCEATKMMLAYKGMQMPFTVM